MTLDDLRRNRNRLFWALHTLGWSAYFITQYVGALLYEKPAATDYLVMDKTELKAFLSSLARDVQAAGGDASGIRQLAKKYESK